MILREGESIGTFINYENERLRREALYWHETVKWLRYKLSMLCESPEVLAIGADNAVMKRIATREEATK
jgi:hypothetical protein